MRARPTRRAVIGAGMGIAGGSAIGLLASSKTPVRAPPLAGVNLAGAEFGQVPGRYATDYLYPSAEHVNYFARLGFNCLRIPFRWERLQPDLNGTFDPKEQELLEGLVADITRRGLTAVIDPHNYARRRVRADDWSQDHLIGSPAVPTETFLDLWRRLTALFKGNEKVIFGLMNEPYEIPAPQWLQIANRAIAAIRRAGGTNLITVPGTAWTGAHSWLSSGNTALEGVVDPLNRFAIEVHQYLDQDSSGTSPEAMSGSCGSERLQVFQAWARKRGVKAFLGEFGAADNPAALNALADICQEMSANPDVWLGWTAWAAGPFWPPDYIFNLGPDGQNAIRPQTQILADYASPRTPSYWVKSGSVIDLDLARDRYHGCSDPKAALAFAKPRVAHSGQPGKMRVQGPLLTLMRRPAFTLLVETEDLATPAGDCDIVMAAGGALLRRTAEGALSSPRVGGWQTSAQQLGDWRSRRRCAFAFSRPQARVAIGATGCGSQSREATLSNLDDVVIDAGPGRIVRVTGFGEFIDGPALDRLIA
jgi:endoglucanase